MTFQEIVQAWSLSPHLHLLRPGVAEDELQLTETQIGLRLPESLRAFYLLSNGAYLLNGNLQIYPLEGEGLDLGLSNASIQLREWQYAIPTEILVFGDSGSDELFGIWLPENQKSSFHHPIIEIGELFDSKCMAVIGTNFISFLLGWTTYYLLLEEAPGAALDAIGVPRYLRHDALDDEHFISVFGWADPNLPDADPDPYKMRYDVADLRRLFGGQGHPTPAGSDSAYGAGSISGFV